MKVDPATSTAVAATTATLSVEGVLLAVSAIANIVLGAPYLTTLINRVGFKGTVA